MAANITYFCAISPKPCTIVCDGLLNCNGVSYPLVGQFPEEDPMSQNAGRRKSTVVYNSGATSKLSSSSVTKASCDKNTEGNENCNSSVGGATGACTSNSGIAIKKKQKLT